MSVTVGDQAPDFTLKDQHGNDVTLSSFKGEKNVVLVFYPFTFTGVCEGELCSLRDDISALLVSVPIDRRRQIRFDAPVPAHQGHLSEWRLDLSFGADELRARFVIACAGLWSDRPARRR